MHAGVALFTNLFQSICVTMHVVKTLCVKCCHWWRILHGSSLRGILNAVVETVETLRWMVGGEAVKEIRYRSYLLLDQYVVLAEKYLVRVWAGATSTTTVHTFNQLRVEQYTSSRAGIDALPPTSSEIRGHIHRGAFLVNRACRLLATDNEREARLEPVDHVWEEHFGTLLP